MVATLEQVFREEWGRVHNEARDAYRRARELTDDGAERRFLERRLTELVAAAGPGQ